ncbi:hypothetical protein DPMN_030387 [Dreissena polymorpha]|uniref:LRAT domain-containing protein n=2 Tax=Dreissena polymorpha TaxID=45954 RepID=A0A9D4M0A5_DREPO|nr:hypothetical protein DPMN_030387 [Dreissena polymorpha]
MQRQCMNEKFNPFKEETDALFEATYETSGVFQVNPRVTKLGDEKFRILKPGDHIACHRWYIIYHHAIVVEVDILGKRLLVIHYSTVDCQKIKDLKCQIIEEWLERDQLLGNWYRINYPRQVTVKNNTEKVLGRARSRLGETDFKILKNNCESFASFCKTGDSHCLQAKWLKGKIKEVSFVNVKRVLNDIPKLGGALAKNIKGGALAQKVTSDIAESAIEKITPKIAIAEGLDKVGNASNYVRAGLVVAAEAGFMAWDISTMYSKRTSRKIFSEMATQRATEAVCASVGTIGLGIVIEAGGRYIGRGIGSAVPVIGTDPGGLIGAFVGSFVGGAIGSVVGRAVGSLLGPQVVQLTTDCIKDDRAVNSIDEIHHGKNIR